MMRILVVSILACFMFMSCDNVNQKKSESPADDSIVYVYYFHGKQRCKTCVTVENVVKQTITENFKGNDKIKYIEVKTDKKENEQLIEKYKITWNALIIAKGDKYVDITNDAFGTAVNSPEVLADQIMMEINKLSK